MLLLIDNYDSFVYNLARHFERLGQSTRVVRNDAIDVSAVRLLKPSGIVLSPGPCTPAEAGVSLQVVRELHAEVPMLGVCLGHQVIAEAMGGRIVRAPEPVHGRTTGITHSGTGVFSGVPSPMRVGRYHSLVAAPDSLPEELRATAWTDDGVLMAFEHVSLPLYGVQFHPESILTEHGYDLLANFLRLSGTPCCEETRGHAESERPIATEERRALPSRPVTF
jgi:anthranilate synthase/aminodeoxychorismate synthase-like glutamine amidotransferase